MHTSFNKVFVLTDMIYHNFSFFLIFLTQSLLQLEFHLHVDVLGIESPLRNKNGIILQHRYLVSVESNERLISRKCGCIVTSLPSSSTCSVEVRGQKQYRWMVIFLCGCRGEFMMAIISIDGVTASLQRATVFYIYPVDPDLCNNH